MDEQHLHAQLALLGQLPSLTKPALEAFKKQMGKDFDGATVEHSLQRDGNVLRVDVHAKDDQHLHGEVALKAATPALFDPETQPEEDTHHDD